MTVYLNFDVSCPDCGFNSRDVALLNSHSCEIAKNGGHCEDYPCCGHEFGDCNGLLYGSDKAIQAEAYNHVYCDHEAGIFDCDGGYDDIDPDDCEHDNRKSDWNGNWTCSDCGIPTDGMED